MATDARSGLWREDEELLPVVSGRRVRNAFGGQATGEDGRGRRLRCGGCKHEHADEGSVNQFLHEISGSVLFSVCFSGWG
ncbi:hypothetical protein [Oryza sativa Japonica Group]|uniref:Uncharacterized protein n=1 Tax=Oryza sativa subsp. japonica TaxID=39947 RepID=Q5ZEI4_ORYSJ|nr:hypothetical protein [Oryza sativa Japonica Group]